MSNIISRLRYELLRGLAYRQIEHPEMRVYTFWLPFVLSIIGLLLYWISPVRPPLLGKDGAFSLTLTLLSTLPGFYFAGLAAVSTFGGTDMDKIMPDPAPTIKIMVKQHLVFNELTRRQFLSYLFSYLVVLSFFLWVFVVSLLLNEKFIYFVSSKILLFEYGEYLVFLIKYVTIFCFAFASSSMIVTTLHGVFFLTERIHQP